MYRRNARTTIKADANDTMNPTTNMGASDGTRDDQLLRRSYSVAASMTGIAKKKDNSVAATRVNPRAYPPIMVAPEREVPGTRDSTCARPIPSAVRGGRSS